MAMAGNAAIGGWVPSAVGPDPSVDFHERGHVSFAKLRRAGSIGATMAMPALPLTLD